jgi:quercetin dioxygenase-like cupin family protein
VQIGLEKLTTIAAECDRVSLGGIGVVFTIPAALTGDAYTVVEHPVRPGTLVPPHLHTREDELSYVVEGEFGARVGDLPGR